MSVCLGFELWGPDKEAKKIYGSIVDAGKKHDIRQLGARAKMVNHLEAGFATPTVDFIPAVHELTDDLELVAFRQYAASIGFDFGLFLSQAAGSHGSDSALYHITPFDLHWGWLMNLDHGLIGHDALVKLKDNPPRKLVTLSYEFMEMPRDLLGKVIGSTVLFGDEAIGCALSRCYSYWFKETLSFGIISTAHAAPGTTVEIKWSTEGSELTRDSNLPFSALQANNSRQIVQAAPYKEDKRRYSINQATAAA
ncbi:glycine cleavage t protein (aminomethyl transferase) [Paramyrothecium foliicola]|nr:glycine cleavage t protein (aminomethyl transferase) [Paramyrothecium foliicola]